MLLPEPAVSRSRWHVPAALAASVLVAAVGLYFGRQLIGPPIPVMSGSGVYETTVAQRTLTLTDGSTVHLDIATRAAVDFTDRERIIRLEYGRALFDVARDPGKPFAVHAGNGQVVAIGTRFQVDRTGDEVKVVLAEGAVVVTQTTAGAQPSRKITLHPGEELVYSSVEAQQWAQRTIDPDPLVSWSRGYHIFRATPLGEAVRDINRYATRKIRIADPSLADLPVSGSFKTGDSESIATALPSVLPVRVTAHSDEIELSRQTEGGFR